MAKLGSPNLTGVTDPSLREALNLLTRNIEILQASLDDQAAKLAALGKVATTTTSTASSTTSSTSSTSQALDTLTVASSLQAPGTGTLTYANITGYPAGVAGKFSSGSGLLPTGATWAGGLFGEGKGGNSRFGVAGLARAGGSQSAGVVGITEGSGSAHHGVFAYAPNGGNALTVLGPAQFVGPISVSGSGVVPGLNAQLLNGHGVDELSFNYPTALSVTVPGGDSTVVIVQRVSPL